MKSIFKKAACLLLICMMIGCSLISCTVSKAYPGAPEGMRPCNDGSNGVIMYVPSNWSVDTSTGIPTAYFSFTDSTMINMVTVSKDEVGERTIPEYFESYKSTFTSSVTEFTLIPYSEELEYTFFENASGELDLYQYSFTFKLSTGTNTVTKYRFAQAYFKTSDTSDLYIITYGTTESRFDAHLEDLANVYKNLKVVTESVSMGEDELPKPVFTDKNAPEGYSALTGEHIDYVLYVPSSWTPVINTGITAASKADDPSVSCNVTAFSLANNNNYYDGGDYDSFFEGTEKSLKESFGNITFADEANKYVKVAFGGVTNTESDTAPRKYSYKISVNGTEYSYEQYIIIKNGYVYLLTLCCKTEAYAENAGVFNGIASNFKFKD